MKRRQWKKLFEKYPHKDLGGKYIAYDIDGKSLGEAVYTKGVLVLGTEIKEE